MGRRSFVRPVHLAPSGDAFWSVRPIARWRRCRPLEWAWHVFIDISMVLLVRAQTFCWFCSKYVGFSVSVASLLLRYDNWTLDRIVTSRNTWPTVTLAKSDSWELFRYYRWGFVIHTHVRKVYSCARNVYTHG